MSRINLLAIYSKEITFLYNFFLSTLLSNHVATAKAAVRGGQAAVGQAAKGRRRGGQAGGQKHRRIAGGGEATWWPDFEGGGARAEWRSVPVGRATGWESGGACGRVGAGWRLGFDFHSKLEFWAGPRYDSLHTVPHWALRTWLQRQPPSSGKLRPRRGPQRRCV
jgi:hypothetical protein